MFSQSLIHESFYLFFWRHKDRQNVENDFILSAENSTFAAVFLMDTNGNILEYYRTIQRGHLVDTAPHHRSRYPAHHATLPETDLMGKTLHENLHGISERVDIHRVLHDVLRSARTPPYTRHLLGSDCSVVAMGFVTLRSSATRNTRYWWGYSMQCLSSTRSFRGHAEWNFP